MSDLSMQTLSVVDAPQARPPIVGLVATAAQLGLLIDDTIESVDDLVNGNDGDPLTSPSSISQRWVGGYRFLPEQQCSVGTTRDACTDTQLTVPTLGSSTDWIVGIPTIVENGDSCSAFGFEAHDYQGRATRALTGSESKQIASEFWTGTVARAESWDNQYLQAGYDTSSGLVHWLNSGGAVSPGAALALIEEGIASHSNGAPAAIHCTRQMGSALSELGNTFRSVDGLIYTYMGNVIIPDAGYPGTGPSGEAVGATQWIFATGLPVVRRSPIEIYPEFFHEALDRTVNTVTFRALRFMSVSVPPCPLVACSVTLQVPT